MPVLRNRDLVTSGDVTWYNIVEGTVLCAYSSEFNTVTLGVESGDILEISNGVNEDRWLLRARKLIGKSV